MGFDGTARCFFKADVNAAEFCSTLKLARQAQILTPSPISSQKCQGLVSASLLLKDALREDFALSTGDDKFLVQSGELWVSCSESTYYKAGIEMKRLNNRYHARFDLSKTNKRLDQSFLLNKTFSFLVLSGAAEESTSTTTVATPPFEVDQDDFEDWAPHFYEWTSLVSLNAPILSSENPHSDPAFCDYFEFPGTKQMSVHCSTIRGLITPEYMDSLLSQTHDWIIITVHGFENSPMAWNKPHHSGSHGYTLIRNGNKVNVFRLVSREDL